LRRPGTAGFGSGTSGSPLGALDRVCPQADRVVSRSSGSAMVFVRPCSMAMRPLSTKRVPTTATASCSRPTGRSRCPGEIATKPCAANVASMPLAGPAESFRKTGCRWRAGARSPSYSGRPTGTAVAAMGRGVPGDDCAKHCSNISSPAESGRGGEAVAVAAHVESRRFFTGRCGARYIRCRVPKLNENRCPDAKMVLRAHQQARSSPAPRRLPSSGAAHAGRVDPAP